MIRLTCWKSARTWKRLSIAMLAAALLAAENGYAQVPPGAGQVSTPESSVERPGDTGVRAHTNTQIFIPNGDRSAGASHQPDEFLAVDEDCRNQLRPLKRADRVRGFAIAKMPAAFIPVS